ncbi:NACHT, LRR and PYD domains-containing protein 1 homolog, partial [Hypanus sabinus]|uniref:NACHT, LRR and PYD domains-containing protein 1 homolog n=1 Tax=Hypanus sabinus TaxID=79690 RepID=UPI0028C3E0C5
TQKDEGQDQLSRSKSGTHAELNEGTDKNIDESLSAASQRPESEYEALRTSTGTEDPPETSEESTSQDHEKIAGEDGTQKDEGQDQLSRSESGTHAEQYEGTDKNIDESLSATSQRPESEYEAVRTSTGTEDPPETSEESTSQDPEKIAGVDDVKLQHRYNLERQNREVNLPKPRSLSDIYIEPTITMKQHEHACLTGESHTHIREVEYHEVFALNNIDSDETTISVVYGAAGTGKTTLIEKIINDWAREEKFQEFSFVLPFKIRKLNAIKSPVTLSKMILDSYPYFEDYLDHLWNEPKRLLFIFDDLERLYRLFTLSDTGKKSDPRSRCTETESEYFVSDVVRCLLQGELLRGCSVLITTRDWKLEALHHVTADSIFEVKGFTSGKAKTYFRRYLGNGQNANEILEFIEQNEILWNMCSDPLFCFNLASSLESFQAQGEEQTTIPIGIHTQVLSDYVAQLLAKCGNDGNTNQKCLSVVGELADKGIRQNTLSFEGNAFRDLDSCPPVFISAFMYQDPDKQRGGVIYEFRHSVFRDFLAALTNVVNATISRLKRILDEISADITGRFSIFSIFLVGLCSRKSSDRLERELHAFPNEVTSCVSEWLRKSVSRRLKNMDMKHNQKMFLCILYSLLEFGDNEIMKEVLNPITTIKLNHLRLKSTDCIVLSRTLISPEVIQELDLSSCFTQPEVIWKLENLLPRCVILRLNQNKLQDSGVKRLFDVLKQSKVKTLALKSNHLTDNCLESVFFVLTKNPSLMQLNLSNSSQDEKQANQFTVEKLKYYYERSAQQKEIKWLRIKNIGQDFTRSSRESNCLTLITD